MSHGKIKNPRKTKRVPQPNGARGRPKIIDIDEEELMKLASYHCTYKEMSKFFGCSMEHLQKNYCKVVDVGRERTRQKLRKAQIDTALDGNPTMLIWMGKQALGQQDQKTIAVAGDVTNTIKIEFVGKNTPKLSDDSNIIDINPEDVSKTISDSISPLDTVATVENDIIDAEIIEETN